VTRRREQSGKRAARYGSLLAAAAGNAAGHRSCAISRAHIQLFKQPRASASRDANRARVMPIASAPQKQRAWGMPGAVSTAASRAKVESTRVSHHGHSRNHPAFPHANGFNGFLRALPGDRAVLPPSSASSSPCGLDISVGISGPHDFAVRSGNRRRLKPLRPSHPALHVRDDREAPLLMSAGRRRKCC